ncbi:MAG: GreA/GreB family elongation factor, partial [Gemmatimonadota bacterium]
QQFVQARLGQLHQRLSQLGEMSSHSPTDRVGLGSKVTVVDLATKEQETFVLVLGEMADFDLGHISVGSPLGRALKDGKRGDEVDLRLPNGARRLRIVELLTVHDQTKV